MPAGVNVARADCSCTWLAVIQLCVDVPCIFRQKNLANGFPHAAAAAKDKRVAVIPRKMIATAIAAPHVINGVSGVLSEFAGRAIQPALMRAVGQVGGRYAGILPFNQSCIREMLPKAEHFAAKFDAPVTIAVAGFAAGAGGAVIQRKARGVRAIGCAACCRTPKAHGIGHISRQGKIFIAESVNRSAVLVQFCGDGAQFSSTNQFLPAQNAPGQQPENDENNSKFHKAESGLVWERAHMFLLLLMIAFMNKVDAPQGFCNCILSELPVANSGGGDYDDCPILNAPFR